MAVHVQLIVNPDAGSYRAERAEALVQAFRRHGAHVTFTESGPDRPLAIDDKADLIVVAGGDGTLRHAVIALVASGRDLPIASYPMGTVNLLHLERGGPTDADAFAQDVLARTRAEIHVPAMVNDTLFCACASVGPDSHAVAQISLRLKRWIGRYAYGVAMLRLLGRWHRPKLQLVTPDKTIACEAVYIAKGTYFAGRYSFAPHARRTEPTLHIVALRKAGRLDYARFVLALVRGRSLAEDRNVIALDCSAIDILGDRPCPVQADGDVVASLPVRITLCESRLTLH